jgi:nucleotide-binding universal stress UspA family protein
MKFDVVLVPVDFSAVSNTVYSAAAELALRLGAKVVVLNVTEPEVDYVGMAPPQAFSSADEIITKGAEAALRVAKEFFEEKSVQVETLHLIGPIVPAILAEAGRQNAGMIVLGSHGHGAIYTILVGSVAEGVIRHAKIPVLVVPYVRNGKKEAVPN